MEVLVTATFTALNVTGEDCAYAKSLSDSVFAHRFSAQTGSFHFQAEFLYVGLSLLQI